MKTPEQQLKHAEGLVEAGIEWYEFQSAIKEPRPAIEIFSPTALMLMFLMLGGKALK